MLVYVSKDALEDFGLEPCKDIAEGKIAAMKGEEPPDSGPSTRERFSVNSTGVCLMSSTRVGSVEAGPEVAMLGSNLGETRAPE